MSTMNNAELKDQNNVTAETAAEPTKSEGGKRGRRRRGNRGNRNNANKQGPKLVKGSTVLLQSAANLSFPVSAGSTISAYNDVPSAPEVGVNIAHRTNLLGVNIPGVIRLGTVSTMGKMDNWSDPGNVWLRSVYNFIRHANSGHANYDAAALGKYFLIYRSCVEYLNWMQNIYGLMMNAYVPQNKYLPVNLVNAYGGNYASLLNQTAQLRYYTLSFGTRLAQMKVPNLALLSSGFARKAPVLMDTPTTTKSSFYVFAPDAFWRFHIGETAQDTYLYTVPTPNGELSAMMAFGEEMLNELLNSEDFNIMSGDIMKAYSEFLTVESIPEDFVVEPYYDEVALWIVHNANPVAAHPDVLREQWNDVRIHQVVEEGSPDDTLGALVMDMEFHVDLPGDADRKSTATAATMLASSYDTIMDLPGLPDPSIIGCCSRLKTLGKARCVNTTLFFRVSSCQDLVISSLCVCAKPNQQFIAQFDEWSTLISAMKSRFDLAPYLHPITYTIEQGILYMSTPQGPIGEITNVGILKKETKYNIDNALMLDLYGG